jgi:surfactin synthase thioesterase subunit
MKGKIDLVCLPFAGGSKYSYRSYEEKASPFLNIISLEYPGRGTRIREPLITEVAGLVEDAYQQIKGNVGQRDYAIYGHSLGGLVGWLLTRKIIANDHTPPLHVFITGTSGPSSTSRDEKKRHLLGRVEFMEEIRKLNGSPDEILQDAELLDYFEPILRADFKASETYLYEESPPLDIPLTVITGTEEDLETKNIELWQKETKRKVDFKRMDGNHFFILKSPGTIVDIIFSKLINYIKPLIYE